MKEMRRVLALVLCLVMLIGIVPAAAFATESEAPAEESGYTDLGTKTAAEGNEQQDPLPEEIQQLVSAPADAPALAADGKKPIDAAIFCSDLHGKTTNLVSILGQISTNGVNYSSIGFVGDTCLNEADLEELVKKNLGDQTITDMYSYAASHDGKDGGDIGTNWNYSGEVEGVSDYYLVYTIRETDMQNASDASTAAPAFTTWYNDLTAAQKALPIFIMSHRPLHDRRGDNAGAATWYSAISTAAESSDIVFFWGHNHTGDNSVDQAAYYVAKDGTETFTVYNGSTAVPNFTYMNAGYIDANGQNPARKPVATTVQIYEDTLVFQDYTTSGEYTNASYSHNVTVDREFEAAAPAVTLTSIAVTTAPTKVTYTVGEELDTTDLVVTGTYSNGTTAPVTGYTLSEVDMSTAGEKEVTVTYEGETATFKITVRSAEPTVNTVECWDDTKQVTVEATGLGLTAVAATNVTGENEKCDEIFTEYGYVAFDIALTGLVEGESVKYSISVVADLDTTNLELYYIDENGDLIPVEYKLTSDELGNAYVEFTADHDGTFVYGSPAVPEGYVLTSLALANIPRDMFLNGSLDLLNAEITATYTKEGAEDFVRKLTAWDFDETNFSGYDVAVAGKQTATFTFDGLTATYDIYVWGDSVADETSGITVALDVAGAEYGVTAVNVAESTNPHVADAVKNVISGIYAAYDISLTYAEGYAATEDAKTVTLPIPEGVVNPVVYYVSDNGYNVVDMNATVNEDGKTVSFETKHFSTYVVGEGTEIEVPENQTQSGSSTIPGEKKTVYVLASGNPSGNVLIVNGNSAGSGYYAVANNNGSVAATGVTIKSGDVDGDGDTETYIELNDATDELWTVAGSYTFECEDGYLYSASTEGTSTYVPRIDDSSTTWSYNTSNHRLSYTREGNTYYLYYSSGWKVSTSSGSASSIYFYVPQEIDTTTTVSGTYSIAGEDETVAAITDATVDLTSTLVFTPESGEATTTVDPAGVTYEKYEGGDPLGVISGISGNTVTLSGKVGKALVKVSYDVTLTVDGTETTKTVTDYITVTATTPDHYSIQLHKVELTVAAGVTADNFASNTYYTYDSKTGFYNVATAYVEGTTYYTLPVIQGDAITAPIALKGVEKDDSYSIWAVVKAHATAGDTEGVDVGTLGDALSWTVSDESIATINTETGVITFTGDNYGTFDVTVAFHGADGKTITDTITISATKSLYTVPGDGTDDFPEYPNEGSVRFDKTASAVGNYSQTGIAKVELSMTGVPYTTGSEIDVVLMLDMTGSMSDKAMIAAEEAAVAFVAQIVKNEDGSYNKNRIAVYAFNSGSSSPYTLVSLGTIDSDTELEAANTAIRTASTKQARGGTPYDQALEKCQSVLNEAKTTNLPEGVESADDYNRQQFCVFMSDGGPTSFKYITNYDAVKAGTASAYTTSTASATGGSNQSDSNFKTIATYTHEYYSTLMKDDGVTMFSVLTGLSADDYPNCATILENIASSSDNAYVVPSGDDTSAVSGALASIAQKIVEAAKNVVVEDKIGEDYTLNFKLPTGVNKDEAGMSEFYIQVLEYQLDANKERTGTPTVLENFTFNANGPIKSHTVNGAVTCGDTCSHVTFTTNNRVTKIEGTYFTYTCAPLLDAEGKEVTNEIGDTITEEYLTWKADKLTTTELVMEYFAYLDNSAGFDPSHQVPAGTYYTNEYATLTYDNVNGNRVQQEFPIPQMTWNGAQVTYVFYLVNDAGQPVNRAGRVIPFAESFYVTDPVTFDVHWNEETGSENILAHDIFATAGVPDVYELYDDNAQYVIRVYQTENVDTNGKNGNYFQISGSDDKQIDSPLDSDTTKNNSTTVVFNTKAGKKYDKYGYYSIYDVGTTLTNGESNITTTVKADDIDYANTTVAFAVVWKPELVEDTVVIDYGLDVVIDVIKNDSMAAGVVGVRADAPANVKMNSGEFTSAKAKTVDVYIDSNNDSDKLKENKIGTASVENMNQIRFSLDKDNGMQFTDPAVFYYEADVNYYDTNNELKTTSMYSSVTVIPATTVYYEDEYVNLRSFVKDADGNYTESTDAKGNVVSGWDKESVAEKATQAVDRPGENKIGSGYDSDNIYGYDPAYANSSTYSLGDAAMVNVNASKYATATFEFFGTGFDIISMTSNTTGTIVVKVYPWNGTAYSDAASRSHIVDTYYGYEYGPFAVTYTYKDGEWIETVEKITAEQMREDGEIPKDPKDGETYTVYQEWRVTDPQNPNALYQVPVMKVAGLAYNKYKAVITASYVDMFDHTADPAGYDFYLDAIRIYDPTGVVSGKDENDKDGIVSGAYGADGEFAPKYEELRNKIIDAGTFAEFFEVANIKTFAENVTYFTKDANGNFYEVAENAQPEPGIVYYTVEANEVTEFAEGTTYFTKVEAESYIQITSEEEYSAQKEYYTYAYEEAEISEFADGTTYYTKGEDNTYTEVPADADFDGETTYYTAKYEKVDIKAFEEGVTYYTRDVNAEYIVTADEAPAEGVAYYTVNSTKQSISKFVEGVTYYTTAANGSFSVVGSNVNQPGEDVIYYTCTVSNITVEGIFYSTFVDGIGKTASIEEYTSFGPNNEVYLAPTQAIAAKMTVDSKNGYEPRVYLGIKSVGGNASVDVYGIDENGKKTVAVDNKELSTATDMYYDITNLIGKVIVIRNSGSEGIVSITNVKTAYEKVESATNPASEEGLTPNSVNAAAETEASMFTVDAETLKLALLSLSEPIKVEQPDAPEGGEPGGNEPGGEPEGGEPGGNEPGGEPEGGEPGGNAPQDPAPSEPVPEETEPEEKESIEETIQDIVEIIRDIIGIIGGMFRGWF